MINTFEDLQIQEQILKALNEMGFEEPTPIQKEAIPVAKSGSDMIGQAQTGTGKTAAFGIPALELVNAEERCPQILILSPTRELAIQVAEEINKMAQYTKIQAMPIYGGQDIGRQLRRLRQGPQIIVATPGRLMDHMNRKSVDLSLVKMIILDEADEMLNMGFVEDINMILQALPEERQTMLFSATMPKAIQELSKQYLKEPVLVRMKPTQVTMDLIEQHYIEVQDRQKFDLLCRLLDLQAPELAIVFTRTKRRVDEVTEGLKKRGYMAEGIHGDLSQAKRDSVIRQFREGTIDILVATDVAARGLDISGVTHVYNYDLPQDPESYVHRVGRTGRAGKAGQATTFVSPREIEHLHVIERLTKRKIERRKAPSLSDVMEGQQRIAVEKLIALVEEEMPVEYRATAEELLSTYDSVSLLAAAIKLMTKEPDTTPVKITEEAPLRIRRKRSDRRSGGSRREGGRRDRGDRRGRRDSNERGDRRERGERRDRNDRKGGRNGGRNDRRDRRSNDKKSGAREGFKPYFKD